MLSLILFFYSYPLLRLLFWSNYYCMSIDATEACIFHRLFGRNPNNKCDCGLERCSLSTWGGKQALLFNDGGENTTQCWVKVELCNFAEYGGSGGLLCRVTGGPGVCFHPDSASERRKIGTRALRQSAHRGRHPKPKWVSCFTRTCCVGKKSSGYVKKNSIRWYLETVRGGGALDGQLRVLKFNIYDQKSNIIPVFLYIFGHSIRKLILKNDTYYIRIIICSIC